MTFDFHDSMVNIVDDRCSLCIAQVPLQTAQAQGIT